MRIVASLCVCVLVSATSLETCSAQGIPEVLLPVVTDLVPVSPKAPWVDIATAQIVPPSPWWETALYYIPNRVLDLIDVFRVDVGVGPSIGAVVRVTEYGEVGVREMMPTSYRIGDFGRQAPFLAESSSEYGVGPLYVDSEDRSVCPAEVGIGADVLIAGAYGGVCFDELLDFVAGFFLVDLKHDDL